MDGEITSTVNGNEKPTENDQSNFGTDYEYRYGVEGTVEIHINGKWWIYATENARKEDQYPSEPKDWGISLSTQNVQPTGLTLVI